MEGLSTGEAAFLGGFVGSILMSLIICGTIFYVLQVIAGWKIFKKAGEKGWKALIPFYNTYIFFKIAGMKKWFWTILGLAFLTGIISAVTGFNSSNIQSNTYTGANLFGAIVYFSTGIFAAVIEIWFSIRVSKVFGHGVGFAIGLIFLSPIFLLILGFGSSKYNKKLAKSWE